MVCIELLVIMIRLWSQGLSLSCTLFTIWSLSCKLSWTEFYYCTDNGPGSCSKNTRVQYLISSLRNDQHPLWHSQNAKISKWKINTHHSVTSETVAHLMNYQEIKCWIQDFGLFKLKTGLYRPWSFQDMTLSRLELQAFTLSWGHLNIVFYQKLTKWVQGVVLCLKKLQVSYPVRSDLRDTSHVSHISWLVLNPDRFSFETGQTQPQEAHNRVDAM